MKVCISEIFNRFEDYNEKYLDGVLPTPSFELMKSFKYFGLFECEIGEIYIDDPVIKISENYDYTDEQLRDVIVHEMIHYYLAYTGIDIELSHGSEFKKEAKRLNEEYGLHVTKRFDMSEYRRCPDTSAIGFFFSKISSII
jgi:hypothetical protein